MKYKVLTKSEYLNHYANKPSVVTDDTYTAIGANAFKGDEKLENIKISNGVNTIRSFAFQDCTNLTHIEFADSIRVIERGAFLNCYNIEELILPTSLEKININTFANNTRYPSNLHKVIIPANVTKVSGHSFCNHTNIDTIIVLSEETIFEPDWLYKSNFMTIYVAKYTNLDRNAPLNSGNFYKYNSIKDFENRYLK